MVTKANVPPVMVPSAPPDSETHVPGNVMQEVRDIANAAPAGESASSLPTGFRRLADLRKRAPKQSYDDLKAWVGKTIRLDGVAFQTAEKDGKTVLTGGTMTFSEFDPSNPDRESDQTTTTQIPRGAIRALYQGLQANPDETIVCDVVQSKRGLALQ